MNSLVMEVDLSHVVHVVSHLRLQHVMGEHSVEHLPFHVNTVVGKDDDVILQVLSHL